MTVHRLAFAGAPLPAGLPARLVFGDEGDVAPPANATAALLSRVARLSGAVNVLYDSRTARATVGAVSSRFDDAKAVPRAHVSRWSTAQPLHAAQGVLWGQALARGALMKGVWADASGHARSVTLVRAQVALPVGTWPMVQSYAAGARKQSGVRALYQAAAHVGAWPVHALYQSALRNSRALAVSMYQSAVRAHAAVADSGTDGLRLRTAWLCHYQQAMHAPIGRWVRPVVPPLPEPCYTPALPVRLVFADAGGVAGMPLVFVCERVTPPEPGGTVVVPVRRIYMTVNNVTLHRTSDGAPIPTLSMSMSLDVDSWTWSFSALVPGYALPDIEPTAGVPVDVQATINGVSYRFIVESISRERTFGRSDLSIGGRGRAAVLDAPYAPIMSFRNEFGRTAQQLMGDILTDNGVPLGWEVEWNPDDWNVPAGVFNHHGSYISALTSVTDSIAAYLQPHNTAETLRVLSRYPVAPWEWGTVTPDYELPAAVMTREGIEWREKARYNRVYVSGQQVGVQGRVTRGGTAGDYLAPAIVDPLITEAAAARQRGLAVLSDTGRIASVSLRMPVLAETGIIPPGKFVSYVDGGTERIGITRSVSVDVGLPEIWQVIGVETHVEPV